MKSTIATFVCLLVLTASTVRATNLAITIAWDKHPEDFFPVWTFTNIDSGEELFPLDNGNSTESYNNYTPNVTVSETFYDLEPGSYLFQTSDGGLDGICCSNGTGVITFANETDLLYEHQEDLTGSIRIGVQVSLDGYVSSISPLLADSDPDWPGYMHNAMNHSFTLNVKFDNEPQSASVLLLKKDDTYFNKGWLDFYDYVPVSADTNTLFTETFVDLEAGVYFLRLTSPGIRWATLTNRTHVFWDMEGDNMVDRTEFYFVVKGWFGYTIPWDWTGNPPP